MTASHPWALAILLASLLLPAPEMAQAAATIDEQCESDDFPSDGPRSIDFLSSCVVNMLVMAAFENKPPEMAFAKWGGNGTGKPMVLLDDGRPRIQALRDGIGAFGYSDIDWERGLAHIRKLRKKQPQSSTYALMESLYWMNYAWNARGQGYASTVTNEGHRLFAERMEQAERTLNESKPYALKMPLWYELMIEVQSVLDRPQLEIFKTFHEGASKYKTYYPIYFVMLNYQLPKWGGSWKAVESLVGWSIENTRNTEGSSMYARLYWATNSGLVEGTRLFNDTHATWPKMKKGFEDLMQRHPKSNWNLNNFAKFACLAKDKKTFIALRKQIGAHVYDEAWSDDLSLDLCDYKMGYASREAL